MKKKTKRFNCETRCHYDIIMTSLSFFFRIINVFRIIIFETVMEEARGGVHEVSYYHPVCAHGSLTLIV